MAHVRLRRTQELHIVTVTALAANKREVQHFAWPRHRLRFFDREQSSCAPRYSYETCEHVQETRNNRRRDTGATVMGIATVAVDGVKAADLRANHPSSSSRRVRAGRGAPGPSPPSVVGSLTLPSELKGLSFCSVPSSGFCGFVFAGCSRRDQPMLFMLSLKDDDAMVAPSSSGALLCARAT